MHTNTCMHTHTQTHMHAHTNTHTHMRACMHTQHKHSHSLMLSVLLSHVRILTTVNKAGDSPVLEHVCLHQEALTPTLVINSLSLFLSPTHSYTHTHTPSDRKSTRLNSSHT